MLLHSYVADKWHSVCENLEVSGDDHYLKNLPWFFSWISVNVSFVVGMQNAHYCSVMMDWRGFFLLPALSWQRQKYLYLEITVIDLLSSKQKMYNKIILKI